MHLYYILLSDEYVLNLLNSGSIKVLVSDLVTVGPKRAQIIHAYRELYGSFKSFEDLYKVPSLKKKYIDTFLLTRQLFYLCKKVGNYETQ